MNPQRIQKQNVLKEL